MNLFRSTIRHNPRRAKKKKKTTKNDVKYKIKSFANGQMELVTQCWYPIFRCWWFSLSWHGQVKNKWFRYCYFIFAALLSLSLSIAHAKPRAHCYYVHFPCAPTTTHAVHNFFTYLKAPPKKNIRWMAWCNNHDLRIYYAIIYYLILFWFNVVR